MNVKLPQHPQECMNCFLLSYIWDRIHDMIVVSSTKVSVESML